MQCNVCVCVCSFIYLFVCMHVCLFVGLFVCWALCMDMHVTYADYAWAISAALGCVVALR